MSSPDRFAKQDDRIKGEEKPLYTKEKKSLTYLNSDSPEPTINVNFSTI